MNRQAKTISIASSYAIDSSLITHNGEPNVNLVTNLIYFSGLMCVALAGSAATEEHFKHLAAIHEDKLRAIPKFIVDRPAENIEAIRAHTIKALTSTTRFKELLEELALLASFTGETTQQHYDAAQWGLTFLSVGVLMAKSTKLLEPETVSPESVASIMVYINHFVMTHQRPDDALVRLYANEPPMLKLAGRLSRSLKGSEFGVAAKILKNTMAPALDMLASLPIYH